MRSTSSAFKPFGLPPETTTAIAVVLPALMLAAFATLVAGFETGSVGGGLISAYHITGFASFGPLAIAVARLGPEFGLISATLGWLFLAALVAIARKTRLRTRPVVCGLVLWVWTFLGCLALLTLAS